MSIAAKPIWHGSPTIADVTTPSVGTLADHCGIVITEIGVDYIRGTMPVTRSLTQPMGLLHGGASVVLAETLGSIGATFAVDRAQFFCVGQEINANHLQSAHPGDLITGTARPVHLGGRSQVWSIEMRDQRNRLICISRITIAVVARRP